MNIKKKTRRRRMRGNKAGKRSSISIIGYRHYSMWEHNTPPKKKKKIYIYIISLYNNKKKEKKRKKDKKREKKTTHSDAQTQKNL